MGTSAAEIKEWFDEGEELGATHMIVCCDTWDWEDYPVFVLPNEDVKKKVAGCQDRVMEVYSYKKTWAEQSSGRVFNYD